MLPCYHSTLPTQRWCYRGNGLPCPERSTVFLCVVLPSKSSIMYLPLSCGVGSLICNQICSPVTPVLIRSVNLIWVSLKSPKQYYLFVLLEYKKDLLMLSHWAHLELLNYFQDAMVCYPILQTLKSNPCSSCEPAGQNQWDSLSLLKVQLSSELAEKLCISVYDLNHRKAVQV